MHGYGNMLTTEVAADEAKTSRVADRLELFAPAPSLGVRSYLASATGTAALGGLCASDTQPVLRVALGRFRRARQ